MEIGKKLKKARVQSGYTQEEVAEQLQVTRQTISNWENEKSYPDIISVISLSEVYQILSLIHILDHDQVTTTQLYAQHKQNVKRDLVKDMEWEKERTEK